MWDIPPDIIFREENNSLKCPYCLNHLIKQGSSLWYYHDIMIIYVQVDTSFISVSANFFLFYHPHYDNTIILIRDVEIFIFIFIYSQCHNKIVSSGRNCFTCFPFPTIMFFKLFINKYLHFIKSDRIFKHRMQTL